MAVRKRRYPKEEFERRGDEVFERVVHPTLTPGDRGKFVAVDIETGEFELAANELAAGDQLLARIPDAQIWMVRVGSYAVHHFGGRTLRSEP